MRNFPVDLTSLEFCLNAKFESFTKLGTLYHGDNHGLRHIHIERGSKVLAVAHLDSVQAPGPFFLTRNTLHSQTIDNRLSVYLFLYVFPRIGIDVDVLLTDNEESCSSTAEFFSTYNDYNWMFSFDRTGTDVVTYQYDSDELYDSLEKHFGKESIGFGSYSDIATLDHLGISGFNVGCGMYDYHSTNAWCNLDDLDEQVERFHEFYAEMYDTRLVHVPDEWGSVYSNKFGGYGRGRVLSLYGINQHDSISDEFVECDFCDDYIHASSIQELYGHYVCLDCHEMITNGVTYENRPE